MSLLLSALLLVTLLGYLTQITGLCMVRGIKEWMAGRPEVMLSILCCGVLAWAVAIAAPYFGTRLPFLVYAPSLWFALGGLLFGLGTAFNQGCGISTLSRLASGDLQMLTTPLGWVVGWCTLAHWQPELRLMILPGPGTTGLAILLVASIGIAVWALFGNRFRITLWYGMMGIGLASGFLYLYQPGWTPSGLLQDLSAAMLHGQGQRLPGLSRYALVLALVLGMSLGALRLKKLQLRRTGLSALLLHFLAGILMGLGAALALGGNDSQLLLALPAFSPAGGLTVSCMLLGIFLGLRVMEGGTKSDSANQPQQQ